MSYFNNKIKMEALEKQVDSIKIDNEYIKSSDYTISPVNTNFNNINNDKRDICQKWLDTNEFDNKTIDQSSISGDSTIYTSSAVTDSDCDNSSISSDTNNVIITEKSNSAFTSSTSTSSVSTSNNQIDILQQIFKNQNTVQSFGNIHVQNSNNVHIGNITYVTGPVHIEYNGNDIKTKSTDAAAKTTRRTTTSKSNSNININDDENDEEIIDQNLFINNEERGKSSYANVLRTVGRREWLAQPPLTPPILINEPVPYVIICHTATETATTQAEMILLVRNIQCFHIESKKWNDIGYNFLIGGEGNIYEGRGWGKVGAHTKGWNIKSIGISFVGCFMNVKVNPVAINSCKLLLEQGVKDGYIAPNYKLLAHCQVLPTESPGKMLFEELKTWSHWSKDC